MAAVTLLRTGDPPEDLLISPAARRPPTACLNEFGAPYAFFVWYVLLMAGGAAVFISYAHQDGAALAAQLQRDLVRRGWDVWLDSARLTGGAS